MLHDLPLWMLLFPAMLGLALGSFLNVCILRIPRDQSILRPPSHCPECNQPLRWWENIPVLSWILLRGRCSHCRTRISAMYPAVELAVGAWFVYITLQFAGGAYGTGEAAIFLLISAAIFGWLLIGLFFTDALFGLLLDAFTLGGTLAGLLLFATYAVVSIPADPGAVVYATTPEKGMMLRLAAVIIAVTALLLLRWLYRAVRKREGMGLGDVKMIAMMVAFLGARLTVLAFMAACVIGSMYAVFLLTRKGSGGKISVPFGSFLALGSFYALLVGNATITWYISLLR